MPTAAEPVATTAPDSPTSSALVELVPWSIARTYLSGIFSRQTGRRGADVGRGEPEVLQQIRGGAGRRELAVDAEHAHRHRPRLGDHHRGDRGAQPAGRG